MRLSLSLSLLCAWFVACGAPEDSGDEFGGDGPGPLRGVVVGQRRLVLIPVGEPGLVLVEHEPHPLAEDPVYVADVTAVLED